MDYYKLKWNFDVSTFKLLGRELITDKITALFELVKNCYDANADQVEVIYNNVSKIDDYSKIIIKDDGIGMSLYDIRYKWMIVGTNSKREQKISPSPYFRKVVGEKGVGRFAVEKLGSKLLIKTTQKGTSRKVCLELDWSVYERMSEDIAKNTPNKNTKLFTDIENDCWIEASDFDEQGTELIIYLSTSDQVWTELDINQAVKELSKLISPLKKSEFPFLITVKSNEFEQFKSKEITNKAIGFATEKIQLTSDLTKGTQETLIFDQGQLLVKSIELQNFGPINFELNYFNQDAKRLFKSNFKGGDIDGIKIYRDGVITTPFAESESKDVRKRDILGIDKRRYSGFFDKVSSQDLLGYIEITNQENPRIKDATNRQDFLDFPEYKALKEFIIYQIEQLEKYLTYIKDEKKSQVKTQLVTAENDIIKIERLLNQISEKSSPELKDDLKIVIKGVKGLKSSVNRGVRQFTSLQKEIVRKENIFMSLMSLQDYATELAHVVRTSLGKIIHYSEFFKTDFPNPAYEELFLEYAHSIFSEMSNLDKAIDFMLSYARSENDFETFDISSLIKKLLNVSYKHIFDKENIAVQIIANDSLNITHNKKFFEDIFENLITNSVKALAQTKDKIIKCSAIIEREKFVVYFSDNGYGIPEESKGKVFDIYYTTTNNSGGAGIGLFTVKKRIEALKGNIEIIESEFYPVGTTFKIELPFNQ